ncbi:MAG: glycosyltransferase [Planctomycetes bacterium]|nr:glycosyltransferase [Planctomycetota bacterium]
MASILCNLPLECFDARENFAAEGIEYLSYGPDDRMLVDGVHYPFDVSFDPSRGSIDDLLELLPGGFHPDFLLLYWPDQEPLPFELERSPIPVVGVVSDYNLSFDLTNALAPFFDVLLCDRGGVEIYREFGFADVREFVQFSFKAPSHHVYPDETRAVDVAFAGNLNPSIHGTRGEFLDRLLTLRERGLDIEVRSGIHGEGYGRMLSRAKVGFNRSVRGEMNLRAFEIPACGTALLMESSNREIREFFEPGEECVLYDDDTFEDTVLELCAHDARRERIARAGHERVQDYRMSKRILAMLDLLGEVPTSRRPADPATLAFGRARAMTQTWAEPKERIAELVKARSFAPDDPRILNDLAVAALQSGDEGFSQHVVALLNQSASTSPCYVPAIANLLWLAEQANDAAAAGQASDLLERRLDDARDWRDYDGVLLPHTFSPLNLRRCEAMVRAARGEPVRSIGEAMRLPVVVE